METENKVNSPVVYIGIIDDLGRKLYSGNITWLREYVQNSIDSGGKTISISLKDNDLEVLDDGSGMSKDDLIAQAFSIGKSFKGPKEIGELGVGIFAGSGTCDRISVITKKEEMETYTAVLDMIKYRQINTDSPKTTFEEGMKRILDVSIYKTDESQEKAKHFTKIRFEGLNRDTMQLIQKEDMGVFIENTVDLPISESFPHKKELKDFLGKDALNVSVILDKDGEQKELTKFSPSQINFTETLWKRDVRVGSKVVGKIWAVYNKAGESFYGHGIRVKRKGLTVGGPEYVESEFSAKYSERFYGEIIVLDGDIEINTSRDWFIASPSLEDFVRSTRNLLNELWGVADFDSKEGVGITNLIESDKTLETQAKLNEEKNNPGTAQDKRNKIEKNEEKIRKKLQDAINFKDDAEKGKIDLSNPTNKLKKELIDRTLSSTEVKNLLKTKPQSPSEIKKPRQNPFPEIVRTFLQRSIIDKNLSEKIGNGDVKDTTERAFTFIELKLKEKIGRKENEHVDWSKVLIPKFIEMYDPPDYQGFSQKRQIEAFTQIMNGFHTFLRNPSAHTFMEDMNNPRNLFQVVLISDFLVNWINQWKKKI